MQLVRRHRQGGVVLQHDPVVGLAVGQLPRAGVLGRCGLRRLQVRDQSAVTGAYAFVQARDRMGDQFVALGGREPSLLHLGLEVGVERAVLGSVIERPAGDDVLRGVQRQRKNELRRDDALGLLRLQLDDQLFHQGPYAVQARHIGVGVGAGPDRVTVLQGDRHAAVHAAHLGDQIVVPSPVEQPQLVLTGQLEHPVAELRLRAPSRATSNLRSAARSPRTNCRVRHAMRVGDVVPLIVVAAQAQPRLTDRAACQVALEKRLEERVEPCALVIGREGRRAHRGREQEAAGQLGEVLRRSIAPPAMRRRPLIG